MANLNINTFTLIYNSFTSLLEVFKMSSILFMTHFGSLDEVVSNIPQCFPQDFANKVLHHSFEFHYCLRLFLPDPCLCHSPEVKNQWVQIRTLCRPEILSVGKWKLLFIEIYPEGRPNNHFKVIKVMHNSAEVMGNRNILMVDRFELRNE